WVASTSAPALGYQWEVRTSGDPGSGATGLATTGTVPTSETSATATGLAPTTAQSAYVRAICAAGDTSVWTGPFTFTTPCAAIATFPFTEPFTTATPTYTPPACWSNPSVSGGEQWRFATTPLTGNNPSPVADHTSGTGTVAWIDASSDVLPNELITPLFDISSLGSASAGFWFLSNNTTNSALHSITM